MLCKAQSHLYDCQSRVCIATSRKNAGSGNIQVVGPEYLLGSVHHAIFRRCGHPRCPHMVVTRSAGKFQWIGQQPVPDSDPTQAKFCKNFPNRKTAICMVRRSMSESCQSNFALFMPN